jgi:preprotein translocase subunit YajC
MFISEAYAQTAAGADPTTAMIYQIAPLFLIMIVFYFLLIRPQQKRMKAHQTMIANVKKGDVVVTAGGLIGKVRSVADDEARIELAPNVEVRVVRSTISDVRTKTDPAPANDSAAS